MKPWECPRCHAINAAWSHQCNCKPEPIAVEPQTEQWRRIRLIPTPRTSDGCTCPTAWWGIYPPSCPVHNPGTGGQQFIVTSDTVKVTS